MKRRSTLLPIVVLLLATACGSAPTQFYTLTPMTGRAAASASAGPSVGVGPVELPKALNRPQIMTRKGQNEFALAELDQWAEPLDENFTQVLAENIATLPPTQRMTVYPWDRSKEIDYQVVVKVLRFDRNQGGDAVLKVRWALKSPSNNHELLARETSYTERPAGEDYKTTGESMNRLLADFSRDVAAALRGIKSRGL
jgi:uncharacterized protein